MRCWIAYSGTPVLLSQVRFQPAHSLIDQSLHSRTGVETTNGDGFGVGNRNPREAAQHTRSRPFFGHIRTSTGTAVQQSNRHPVRSGRWRWMHPARYADIGGSTDSEVMFYIVLTFGLKDDRPVAMARMAGLIEKTADAHGVTPPLQMSIAVTDGAGVWDLPGAWSEVAESSCGVVHPGGGVLLASRPEHTDGPLSMR